MLSTGDFPLMSMLVATREKPNIICFFELYYLPACANKVNLGIDMD